MFKNRIHSILSVQFQNSHFQTLNIDQRQILNLCDQIEYSDNQINSSNDNFFINDLFNVLHIQILMKSDLIMQTNELGIHVTGVQDFNSGVKLFELVNRVLYNSNNSSLRNKIIIDGEHRRGNNIINIQMILKHLKNDSQVELPENIIQLTPFNLIESSQNMLILVKWLLQLNQKKKSNKQEKQKELIENHKCQDISEQYQLDNLYFAAHLQCSEKDDKEIEKDINDSLEHEQVVRKGSFKILKPKAIFSHEQDTNNVLHQIKIKEENKPVNKAETSEISEYIDKTNSLRNKSEEQPKQRKTVPKMAEKPPIYKQINKQNTQLHKKQTKDPINNKYPNIAAFSEGSSNHSKSQQKLKQSIYKLQEQIDQEKKSQEKVRRSPILNVFKIQIKDIEQQQRVNIMQWLISINLLNTSSMAYCANLHQICANGIIFSQIINQYQGRSQKICYFKNPKKSAELHANYQKIFTFLKQSACKSDLLFIYQYFIPQVHEKAFWSLLNSLFGMFYRPHSRLLNSNTQNYETSIKKKLCRTMSLKSGEKRKSIENEHTSIYECIRHSNTNTKSINKVNNKQIIKDKQIINSRQTIDSKLIKNSRQTTKTNPKQKSTLHTVEFIEEVPNKLYHQQLVQKQQPKENIGTVSKGYKQLHQIRTKGMQTPKKIMSYQNSSLSRSRVISMSSIKKNQSKPIIVPSITLEMQMKVLKFLDKQIYYQYSRQNNLDLFRDPYRNGVLLNVLSYYNYIRKPKNIDDCRNNFKFGLQQLKLKVNEIPYGYIYHSQEVIKGDRSLLYGMLWYVMKAQGFVSVEQKQSLLSLHQPQQQFSIMDPQKQQQAILLWIRNLEQNNQQIVHLKIRDFSQLIHTIINQPLLYWITEQIFQNKIAISPTYDKAITVPQKQNNLKKILSYLVQCKIIASDNIWKTKNMIKRDIIMIKKLLQQLMTYWKSAKNRQEHQTVTFIKYVRKDQSSKNGERLQTTMANQSVPQCEPRSEKSEMTNEIDVKWMRKLGFNGDLSLNNGVLLCRLMQRITMKNIDGLIENPSCKAECLGNIRRGIKLIPKCTWDQYDIYECGKEKTLQIYNQLRKKLKNTYAMKFL